MGLAQVLRILGPPPFTPSIGVPARPDLPGPTPYHPPVSPSADQHAPPRPIRVLPTLVANQIAAGEVVERPASVVKELIENAIDAAATRISLDLEQGGIELVRVTDDGQGIPADQLALAIAPHATSKVESATDLEHISTLGFRGEALASIASVSRTSIRSRTRDDLAASAIDVEGSAVSPVRPAPGPVGTSVTVRNLFFNTPARRKFLRTIATEQDRCLDVLRQLALAHPAIGFHATVDGREVVSVPAAQSPHQRALDILGKELAPQLLSVHADQFDDARGVALWGLAGHPAIARGTSKHQHVFVNGRPVRDRTIQHAISEAYRGLIDHTRYPTVLLMLEMSPQGVDVNVHPQKAEVRFRDTSLVHSVILHALRGALRAADLTPTLSEVRASPPAAGLPGSGLTPPPAPGVFIPPDTARFVDYFTRFNPRTAEPIVYADHKLPQAQGVPQPELPQPRAELRVLQVHKSFLVTQDEQGVVIIDQHALHERVMFEYLLARVLSGPGLEQQHLLAPVVVAVSPTHADRLCDLATLLGRIGVDARPIAPGQVGVHAFPTFLFDRGVDPADFIEALLERADDLAFVADAKAGGESAMRQVLDMMACKAAVKAGDRLSDPELDELVKLRLEVERSSNCPHGRPTSVRLTIRELEKTLWPGVSSDLFLRSSPGTTRCPLAAGRPKASQSAQKQAPFTARFAR
jgi:DNA mismatch repair protein MutL